MFVTLEVSHFEISALKFCMPLKSQLMSVMAETSQSATGPYVAMAAVGLASYAWTAVCRSDLVAKVPGGGIDGGDGGGLGGGEGGCSDAQLPGAQVVVL